jgi:hypothetical protein
MEGRKEKEEGERGREGREWRAKGREEDSIKKEEGEEGGRRGKGRRKTYSISAESKRIPVASMSRPPADDKGPSVVWPIFFHVQSMPVVQNKLVAGQKEK